MRHSESGKIRGSRTRYGNNVSLMRLEQAVL
jgi:hypothetical protein